MRLRPGLYLLGVVLLLGATLLLLTNLSDPSHSPTLSIVAAIGMALLVVAELGVRERVARADVVVAIAIQVALLVAALLVRGPLDCDPVADFVARVAWAHAASLLVVGVVRGEVRRLEVQHSRVLAAAGGASLAVGLMLLARAC